jgi:hypothetical protein
LPQFWWRWTKQRAGKAYDRGRVSIADSRTQSSRIAHRAVDPTFSISHVLQKSGANVSYGIDYGGGRCGHIVATWTEIRPHGLGTPASTLTWGAVRRSHVYSTGFTLAGLGRMQRFAHRWRQHRRICCGATVEHQHRHIVCVASAFPTDGQLAQQAHRDRASSRSRRSVATFCHHPARSVLCRRPLPSPLDARQIQVHEAVLLPELQMKAWEKLAQSVSAKFSWARLVLTRRTVTVASPPGRDLGLSSRACR